MTVAPWAEEEIDDGLPAFKLDGRPLVRYGASKGHCGFCPMSPDVITEHRDDLEGFKTFDGTIRFAADHPLPPAVVRRLVWARIAELRGPRNAATSNAAEATKEPTHKAGS